MPILSNPKHEAVAQRYIAYPERIGWRAYRTVYPRCSEHTAGTCFSRLWKNVGFRKRVAELAELAAQHAVMQANEVLQELTNIARLSLAVPSVDELCKVARVTP